MEITVTRALAMVKQLDDKIQREVNSSHFIGITQGRNHQTTVVGYNGSAASATSNIQGSYDRVEQLMKNRQVLKSAIIMSNATTEVQVGSKTMTVAEAIELRRSIGLKQQYLDVLKTQYTQASRRVDALEAEMENTIQASLTTVLGNEKGKVDEATITNLNKFQKDKKQPALLDPCDIRKKISTLEEEISAIDTELDFILSESNASTKISVEI